MITNSGSGGSALNGTVNIADWTGVGSGPASGAADRIRAFCLQPLCAVRRRWDLNRYCVPDSQSEQRRELDVFGLGSDEHAGSDNRQQEQWWRYVAGGDTVYYLGATGPAMRGAMMVIRQPCDSVRASLGDAPVGESGSDGNWHMITYEDSGGTQAIYLDGQNLNPN